VFVPRKPSRSWTFQKQTVENGSGAVALSLTHLLQLSALDHGVFGVLALPIWKTADLRCHAMRKKALY
jgi:hypothetical protein